MFNFLNKKIKKIYAKGFTLVEMTIVIAIFGLLTVVVVVKYGDFTSNLLISNMAYEVALTTRQAQVYGVGVRGYEADGVATDFSYPYGVYFNLNDGSGAELGQTKNFILFADRDDNKMCDSGFKGASYDPCTCAPGDECVDLFSMQRNIRLTEIRLGSGSGCLNDGGPITSVAVSFKRPSPEARIKRQDEFTEGFPFTQLKIEAPNTNMKPSYVMIRNNGQISVSSKNICGPDPIPDENE